MTDDTSTTTELRIQALPQHVVDRIAAGEVVQRPASVVKELIENSLDADATTIDVQCQNGGMKLLIITDDGCGIHPDDLPLAATRFATSKLKKIDDLKNIMTFGFRGEALASASMVGNLTIISRRKQKIHGKDSLAYKMSYKDGLPSGTGIPQVSAGRVGTVVRLEDLFHTIPSRKRAFEGARKESEEYQRILTVVQRYAVHYAKEGIGFVCRKKGGSTDLNTANLPCIQKLKALDNSILEESEKGSIRSSISEQSTKDVIGHIYGTELQRELMVINCHEGDVELVSREALRFMTESSHDKQALEPRAPLRKPTKESPEESTLMYGMFLGQDFASKIAKETEKEDITEPHHGFAYKATGYISNGSYCVPKSSSAFLLFINGRLVESGPLRRAIEGIYNDILPKSSKPFIYLSLELPGPQIDVNIHPTKREVAFLHEERLCDALVNVIQKLLRSTDVSRTFYTQTLLPEKLESRIANMEFSNADCIAVEKEGDTEDGKDEPKSEFSEKTLNSKYNEKEDDKSTTESATVPSKKRKTFDPKTLVRTNSSAQQGAIEPFLITTQKSSFEESFTSSIHREGNAMLSITHDPDCPFISSSKIDLSIPGAFASICRCQIDNNKSLPRISYMPPSVVRPKKLEPTKCAYDSIQQLRDDIPSRSHADITAKLRDSVFVGCLNKYRCLLQSGTELLLVNHYNFAKELFFQLALLRFGGMPIATFDCVDIQAVIEHALLVKDSNDLDASLSQMKEEPTANESLAKHQTLFLSEKADMLLEYFSIRIEEKEELTNEGEHKTFILSGLPIILDGHSPSPHALPIFLSRLVTEVEWTSEKTCFEGICTELAAFYAQIPPLESQRYSDDSIKTLNDNQKKYIQHTLYPAIRHLLVVPKDFATDGSFYKLALLSKLYKVFERC